MDCLDPSATVKTPPFRGTENLVQENVDIIFVSVTSTEGAPLFRGKGHFLWDLKHGINLHLGDTSALKI